VLALRARALCTKNRRMRNGPLLTLARTCALTVDVCAPTAAEALFRTIPRPICDTRLARWASGLLDIAEVQRHVTGQEHVSADEAYVVVSNHQSTYDIMLLLEAFPGTLRMVSKKEMFNVPFVGRAMAAAEFICLDRSDRDKARASLVEAAQRLASGVNIWIAPEGTRSADGRMLPFKAGAFWLALETGAKILPTTVVGSRDVLPSKGLSIRNGARTEVHFHAPIDPADFGRDGRKELAAATRAAIEGGLPPALRSSAA
jgi:1-acyl-sn-glycerol-3-phosphate acyltransferase